MSSDIWLTSVVSFVRDRPRHATFRERSGHTNPLEETYMEALDLRGLVPAPITPFTRDGEVDHAAIQRLGSWLGSFKGVKGLVVLGHAGEGTFLTPDEQT